MKATFPPNFVWNNYTAGKWELKETFCQNSLMHLFNGDRPIVSQVPRLPWMSVGRTNPLRAGFFSSGASGAKNVAFTPPYNIHNWIPLHVTWPRASPKLLKFNSSRSYGRFRCASSLSTRAHPVCPLITDDFFLKLYFSVSDLGFVPLWILWCLFNIW